MAATLHHESDGQSVQVALTASVEYNQVAVVESWVGITESRGDSGDTIAMTTDDHEYQWPVPDSLSVAKGEIVYVDTADLTGHTPDSTAYSKTSGAGKIKLFKATAAKDTSLGSGNHFVTGKSLLHMQSL